MHIITKVSSYGILNEYFKAEFVFFVDANDQQNEALNNKNMPGFFSHPNQSPNFQTFVSITALL